MTSVRAFLRPTLAVTLAVASLAACPAPGRGVSMPSPAATKKVAAAPKLDRKALADRLLPLVQVAHASRRLATLAAEAAGIVSNNGSAFISDQGGGLVSDQGGGLISDKGGSLVSNNGAGYHLSQVVDRAPSVTPFPGEAELERDTRTDGAPHVAFATGESETRDVYSRVDGGALLEERVTAISYHPNGAFKAGRTTRRIFAPDGSVRAKLVFDEVFDADGKLATLVSQPSTFEDPDQGIDVEIVAMSLDMATRTGSFDLRYKHLGLVETGTLRQLAPGPQGQVAIDLVDPLALCSGTSEVRTEGGQRRYARTHQVSPRGQDATYDLGEGFGLALRRATPIADFTGTLTRGGEEVAKATLAPSALGLRLTVAGGGLAEPLLVDGMAPASAGTR